MSDLSKEAVETLANELLLYRFGGHLVEGDYHINLGAKNHSYHRSQALANARLILAEDRLVIRKQERQRVLTEVAEAFETRKKSEAIKCSEVAAWCREQEALNA